MKLYGSPSGGFPGGANQPGTDESGYVL